MTNFRGIIFTLGYKYNKNHIFYTTSFISKYITKQKNTEYSGMR